MTETEAGTGLQDFLPAHSLRKASTFAGLWWSPSSSLPVSCVVPRHFQSEVAHWAGVAQHALQDRLRCQVKQRPGHSHLLSSHLSPCLQPYRSSSWPWLKDNMVFSWFDSTDGLGYPPKNITQEL